MTRRWQQTDEIYSIKSWWQRGPFPAIGWALVAVLATLAIVVMFVAYGSGCQASRDTALRVLDQAGYTDVQLGGYPWLECGRDDNYGTAFTAKGPSGRRVDGAVCCGFTKDCTIRIAP